MASEKLIYTGVWTNWAEGRVAGSTLTLSARDGAYLVALLALFVRIAGGHLWSIICFAVFRIRSSSAGHDGLFLQHQAVLRNNTSDSGALWQFLCSAFHWRGRAESPLLRSLGLATLAVSNIAIFAVAGVVSSRAASTNSQYEGENGRSEGVKDPWFNNIKSGQSQEERTTQALGCSSQYSICTPQTRGDPLCGRLSSFLRNSPSVKSSNGLPIALNAVQKSILPRLTAATLRNAMPRVPQFLGASSMMASSYLYQQSSYPPQADQWILELSNWFSTSLIALQLFSTSYVQSSNPEWGTKQSEETYSTKKSLPAEDEKWMCSNQIVRRDDYASFSVLDLSLVLGAGLIIVVINLSLKELVQRLQPKTPKNVFRSRDWTTQGTLQLQRLAYEKHGLGHREGEGDFPLTKAGETFPSSMDTFAFHRLLQDDADVSSGLTGGTLSSATVVHRVADSPGQSE